MTDTTSPYTAPRFHAEFERVEQRSVLLMRREEWDRMKAEQSEQVSISVEKTPSHARQPRHGLLPQLRSVAQTTR